MAEYKYSKFLQEKLQDQLTLITLLQQQMQTVKQMNNKLLAQISSIRKIQRETKTINKQLQDKNVQLKCQIDRMKELKNIKIKESKEKRLESQKKAKVDPKQIFRQYIDNTFPIYKGTIKKIMKVFFIVQNNQNKQPEAKLMFYREIIANLLKRLLDWIFPSKTQTQKNSSIAEKIVQNWKKQEDQNSSVIKNKNILKEAAYIKQNQDLQAQILKLNASNKRLENRIQRYQKTLQFKGAEFVAHLKKMVQSPLQLQPESYEKVEQITKLFQLVEKGSKIQQVKQQTKNKELNIDPFNEIPLVVTEATFSQKKKSAPIVKKNIYGYFQDPQFINATTLNIITKHPENSKSTQTLSEDLCILTLHPVIMVTLIDANIRPQRNRHSQQFYVKIRINDQNTIDSTIKESLQPVWNQLFLLRDYDFPFIRVQLMHKSKGLRDNAVGDGKFSVAVQHERIVNVRKQKQFQGRVRFSLSYPKGNIYEFKITAVILQTPPNLIVLKQQVVISFPFNQPLLLQFLLPQKVIYKQSRVLILQNSENCAEVALPKQDKKQSITVAQFIQQEGNREVVVQMEDNWKVIIQGEVHLLVCQDQEPERISEQLINSGKAKYFAVRAPPPIQSVSYNNIVLDSNIKFPLVFRLDQETNKLIINRELANRQIQQYTIEPIVTEQGLLKLNESIKAPAKIYQIYIVPLEGQPVQLRHKHYLFQRLPKQIKLFANYRDCDARDIVSQQKMLTKKNLSKEFTIESKELLVNHYRVFNKHFKRIGFVKFKLGYCAHDNLLKSQENSIQPIKLKAIQIPQARNTDEIFIEIQLSEAHLKSKSSTSHYSCKINQTNTKLIKGSHPVWKQKFLIGFNYSETRQIEVNIDYQIIEEGLLGSKSIYSGSFMINDYLLRLGTKAIPLDTQGQDCLHFVGIRIPTQVFHLKIQKIEADIEQQADWIGQIDPYISLSSNNRQILKTSPLYNVGNHPVWDVNISVSLTTNNQQILRAKLHDYDLIGRDDYLGEVIILDPSNLNAKNQQIIQILQGQLIKDNKICGSLRLKGQFIIQNQQIEIKKGQASKLGRQKKVYRLILHRLHLDKIKQWQGERGWIHQLSDDQKMIRSHQFIFNDDKENNLEWAIWIVSQSTIKIQVQRERKNFFKTIIETIGSINVQLEPQKCSNYNANLIDKDKKVIGSCQIFGEIKKTAKYGILSEFSFCQSNITLRSDLGDSIIIDEKNSYNNSSRVIFYQQNLIYCYKENQLPLTEGNPNQFPLISKIDNHISNLGLLRMELNQTYFSELQEISEKSAIIGKLSFKRLKYIHWQPYVFKGNQNLNIALHLNSGSHLITQSTQNAAINDYVVLDSPIKQIIFDQKDTPRIQINGRQSEKQKTKINLSNGDLQIVSSKEGTLYYELQNYNSSVVVINFSYLFINIKKDIETQKYPNVACTIRSVNVGKQFSCKPIIQGNSFLLQNIVLILGSENVRPEIISFTGELTKIDKDNKKLIFLSFQFNLKVQIDKKQYRVVDKDQFIVHASFNSTFIQNVTKEKQQKIPSVSCSIFKLYDVELEMGQNLSSQQLLAQIRIGTQQEKRYLHRNDNTTNMQSTESSLLILNSTSIVKITLIQQGMLSRNITGSGLYNVNNMDLLKDQIKCKLEVKKKDIILGVITLKFVQVRQAKIIQMKPISYNLKSITRNLQTHINYKGQVEKNQKITISPAKQSILAKCDNAILPQNSLNYQVTIYEEANNKLLGQFKIYSQFKKTPSSILVLQPLRTSKDTLNGILAIEYTMKQIINLPLSAQVNSKEEVNNSNAKQQLVEIIIDNIAFKQHFSHLEDHYSLKIQSNMRINTTKLKQIPKPDKQEPFIFTIYKSQNCRIILQDRSKAIGVGIINFPFFDGQQRIIELLSEENIIGIFIAKLRFLSNDEANPILQIVSVQANDLKDTETFVKMTPFLQIQCPEMQFVTELGQGRQKVSWMINLLSRLPLNFIVKDKDVLFDDFIGSAILNTINSFQNPMTEVLQLYDGENIKSGTITIEVNPIKLSKNNPPKMVTKSVTSYILQLGKLSAKLASVSKSIIVMQVDLIKDNSFIQVYKCQFEGDIQQVFASENSKIQIHPCFQIGKQINLRLGFYSSTQCLKEENVKLEIGRQESINEQLQQLFTTSKLKSFQFAGFSPFKIYILLDNNTKSLQGYCSTQFQCQQLYTVFQSDYVRIFQIKRLFKKLSNNIYLVFLQKGKQIFHAQVSVDISNKNENHFISKGSILNMKNKQIGNYFIQFSKFQSRGSNSPQLNYHRQSSKKCLSLIIIEAILIKDMQIFSKMDPYCKFRLQNQNSENWRKTKIMDNVGLHPIWNEQFFLLTLKQVESVIELIVMDSEATIDRMIGKAKISVDNYLKTGGKQEVNLLSEDKQLTGKLVFNINIITTYIVFRNFKGPSSLKVYFLHEKNRETQEGAPLIIGHPYPLDKSQLITLKVEGTKIILTIQQLHNLAGKIIFCRQCISIDYDLFE